MQNSTDAELLRDYAQNRSEAAFGEIVRRYADVVYSAALRQVGNAEQARDVAQTVFADLARKAGALPANSLLVGWLHRGARLAALEQLRKDQRRQQRERQAMEFPDAHSETPDDWASVRPVLDEAIASLGHEDRDALLLRFFKNESLSAVGTALGVSEDAAQKRVSRALDRLREFLAGRGITTTGAALISVLATNTVRAAPAGFAAALAAGALAKAGVVGGSAVPLLKRFTIGNMKTTALILTLSGGLAALALLQVKAQRELRDARALAQQPAKESDALREAREQVASLNNELGRLRRDAQDVLRLRAEVARLQRDIADGKALLAQAAARSETNRTLALQKRQINIKAKIVSVPAGFASGDATGILTDTQFKQISDTVEKTDSTVLSNPQVLTLSGREARMMIGESIPVGGGYTNLGLIMSIIPTCSNSTPAVSLDLVVHLAKLADGPAPEDGSIPGVLDAAFTNSVDLWSGQTVMLTRKMAGFEKLLHANDTADTTGPRSLIVFLTPTIVDGAGNNLFSEDEIARYQDSDAATTFSPGDIPVDVLSTNRLRASAFPGSPPTAGSTTDEK